MRRKKKNKPLDLQGHMVKLRQRFADFTPIKHCRVCKTLIVSPEARYCFICGSKHLQPGRMPEMLYKSIKLNENGKAIICPHCDNEELTPGEFCMICGSNIVNRCADTPDAKDPDVSVKSCRMVLSGNARFCPKCGNESSFYQKGWLKDWRSENTKRAIENINMAVDFQEIKQDRTSG